MVIFMEFKMFGKPSPQMRAVTGIHSKDVKFKVESFHIHINSDSLS